MTRFHCLLTRLCSIGLLLLLQGPAMLVQEVAWGSMLVNSPTKAKSAA